MNAPNENITAAPTNQLKGSVRHQVSAAEWQARVDLAACYRLVAEFGMTEMVANHISARVPDTDNEFLLNPYGMLYEEMTASSMIKVDLSGKILLNSTDYGINAAGYVIHSAVHKARHDASCVIHTHTLAGMAVSAMKCGVLPIAQSSMRFIDIGYHDFEGVALRIDEQERLVAALGDREVLVLRNHGLLATGPSIPQCFNNMYRLERTCQIQVLAMSCNTELLVPSQDAIRYTNDVLKPTGVRRRGELEWPALLRKLDRIDPSYRE